MSCSTTETESVKLKGGNWLPGVKSGIERRLNASGNDKKTAVFDFDNTIINGDIGEAVFEDLVNREIIRMNENRLALSPSFSYNDEFVSINSSSDFLDYYDKLLNLFSGTSDATPYASAYAWAVNIMTGLSLDLLIESTGSIINGVSDTSGFESISSKTSLRPEMIDLIARLIEANTEIIIVSASNVWSVRHYILKHINPILESEYNLRGIEPANIHGINTLLLDKRDGRFYKDEYLVRVNESYANLEHDELTYFEITSQLNYPVPSYYGKRAVIDKYVAAEEIFLIAGDSPNDIPMMQMADNKLWIARLEKPNYQKIFIEAFRDGTENNFVQPVIKNNHTGFLNSGADLEEEFSGKNGVPVEIIESLQHLREAEFISNFK
jgi:phosphoserine phosphatase